MLVYPIEWHRKVRRRWRMRSAEQTDFVVRSFTENGIDDDRCARCKASRPVSPIRSRYRGPGWVEHDWRCTVCRNEWTSTMQVPS
jgi:hypothetical protein